MESNFRVERNEHKQDKKELMEVEEEKRELNKELERDGIEHTQYLAVTVKDVRKQDIEISQRIKGLQK